MVVPPHLLWKSLIHWSMAFFWAVEPSAFSEPLAHATGDVPALAPLLVSLLDELPLEPQAVSARAPAAHSSDC